MIIIAGDSWGVGSWSFPQHNRNAYSLTGTNFATLASLHNDLGAVNLCGANGQLHHAIDRYKIFLNRYTPDISDTFYWILTDPLRGIDLDTIKTWTTIEQAANDILKDVLQKANVLAEEHKIKINLIGGLCDLDTALINDFDNLVCAVPSWCQLLNKNYTKSIFFDSGNWPEIGKYIKKHRLDLMDEWLTVSNLVLRKYYFYNKHPIYFNRHDTHPTPAAQKVLKDYLYPEFTTIF
jgi:hypothetical protein